MQAHVRSEPGDVALESCKMGRRDLGLAIWLLLLLREWKGPADIYVRSGNSVQARELGDALGISERQGRRELQRLRLAGYVELQNTGRGFKIRLLDGGPV